MSDSDLIHNLDDPLPDDLPPAIAAAYHAVKAKADSFPDDRTKSVFCRVYDIFHFVLATSDSLPEPVVRHILQNVAQLVALTNLPVDFRTVCDAAVECAHQMLKAEESAARADSEATLRAKIHAAWPDAMIHFDGPMVMVRFADPNRDAAFSEWINTHMPHLRRVAGSSDNQPATPQQVPPSSTLH